MPMLPPFKNQYQCCLIAYFDWSLNNWQFGLLLVIFINTAQKWWLINKGCWYNFLSIFVSKTVVLYYSFYGITVSHLIRPYCSARKSFNLKFSLLILGWIQVKHSTLNLYWNKIGVWYAMLIAAAVYMSFVRCSR